MCFLGTMGIFGVSIQQPTAVENTLKSLFSAISQNQLHACVCTAAPFPFLPSYT